MRRTTKEYCLKCKYCIGNRANELPLCGYILKTGKSRKCEYGKCDKFEKYEKREKKEVPWDELLTTPSTN